MQAIYQTLALNPPVLDPELDFGFEYASWFAPDPNHTSHDDASKQENTLTPDESRRLRRMKSNCESARRSRMRKRVHLEELRIQLDQLQAHNRDLRSRLGYVLNRSGLIRRENERLQIEGMLLKRRLDEARTLLSLRRLRRVNVPQIFHGFGRARASARAPLIV